MSTQVLKADGTFEFFKERKLIGSLQKAGAKQEEIERILATIRNELFDGIRTDQIYRRAFSLLKKMHRHAASRYSMRRALFDLGPTGFPFEDFIARLFQAYGYTTQTRVTLKGRCVTHEIDLIGYKDDECFIAEAKFHLRPGIKSDIQTALYSYARFLDLEGLPIPFGKKCPINKIYVVTNTKFSSMAENYAACKMMHLLSWTSPKGHTLQDMVEKTKLYPITAVASLSKAQKASLIQKGAILCKDIVEKPQLLSLAGVPERVWKGALEEAHHLSDS